MELPPTDTSQPNPREMDGEEQAERQRLVERGHGPNLTLSPAALTGCGALFVGSYHRA